jgi:hypothetical protein
VRGSVRWALSPLDCQTHLLRPAGDHPWGVVKARCGAVLPTRAEQQEQPPRSESRTCWTCAQIAQKAPTSIPTGRWVCPQAPEGDRSGLRRDPSLSRALWARCPRDGQLHLLAARAVRDLVRLELRAGVVRHPAHQPGPHLTRGWGAVYEVPGRGMRGISARRVMVSTGAGRPSGLAVRWGDRQVVVHQRSAVRGGHHHNQEDLGSALGSARNTLRTRCDHAPPTVAAPPERDRFIGPRVRRTRTLLHGGPITGWPLGEHPPPFGGQPVPASGQDNPGEHGRRFRNGCLARARLARDRAAEPDRQLPLVSRAPHAPHTKDRTTIPSPAGKRGQP